MRKLLSNNLAFRRKKNKKVEIHFLRQECIIRIRWQIPSVNAIFTGDGPINYLSPLCPSIILLIAGLLEVAGCRPEVYPRFFSFDPSIITIGWPELSVWRYFPGNENAACWNGVRHLDRHRRRWGGNQWYPSAGEPGVLSPARLLSLGLIVVSYHWAKTQCA